MKRPIEVLLVRLRPVLKAFNVAESITCCPRLFQLLRTLSKKKYRLHFNQHRLFKIFAVCLLVLVLLFSVNRLSIQRTSWTSPCTSSKPPEDLLYFFALQVSIIPLIPAIYRMAVSLNQEPSV